MTHKVLLIDDDESLNDSLTTAAVELGCKFFQYTDASTAIDSIGNIAPAVILIDLRMADIDGFVWDFAGLNICRFIRTLYEEAFPIVILTSNDNPATVSSCLTSGADDFLVKDEGFRMLRQRLRSWLALSAARKSRWDTRFDTASLFREEFERGVPMSDRSLYALTHY